VKPVMPRQVRAAWNSAPMIFGNRTQPGPARGFVELRLALFFVFRGCLARQNGPSAARLFGCSQLRAKRRRCCAVQKTIGRKIRRLRKRPLAALPNPLPNHLERHTEERDRVKPRVSRPDFSAGLAADDALFHEAKVPAFEILHFAPMVCP
jgi:hypothetical protein